MTGLCLARDAALNNGKFVAPQARHDIGFPQHVPQPLGNAFQQSIPGGMSKGVVDFLESIEVDPVEREPTSGFQFKKSVLQLFAKPKSVGKLRQMVRPSFS